MDQRAGFRVAVSQNKYLSMGDDEMSAVLTVRSEGVESADHVEAAEVIVIDCSGSMDYPPTKITNAKRATMAAIDALRDGAYFAVVAGTEVAKMVYPTESRLVAVTPDTRRAAKYATRHLRASGGTAIGVWLLLARELLVEHATAVRHVIMLTDGQNHQPSQELDRVLATCAEEFTCDCRGIGEDWEPRELLRIAAALHGSADAVRHHAELAEDFAAMTRSTMGKRVAEARILVRTTEFAKVDFLRQVFPTESDLAGQPDGPRVTVFPTGSWGDEEREFQLRLRVDPTVAEPNQDVRAARVDVQLRRPGSTEFENAADPAGIFVHPTTDLKLSTIIDPKVAHYTDQAELGDAVMQGCDAHDRGDLARAEERWGHAVALATQLGNEKVLARLLRLVDPIGEPRDGQVRIKDTIRGVDLLSAAMGSVVSSMSPDTSGREVESTSDTAGLPELTCASCAAVWPANSEFCGNCGNRLGGRA
jgi:Mg-chelatase subunit ChlD